MAVKKEGVTYISLLNDIRKKQFRPIYVLMGEESYYIDKLAEAIAENALTDDERDFNQTIFYGSEANVRDVISTCKRYPVMAARQLVVLREAQQVKNNELDLFKFYAEKPLESTVLVICNKGGKIKAPEFMKMLKAKKSGIAFESEKLKEGNVGVVIKNFASQGGCNIDDKSVKMLTEFIGTDLTRLVGALEKLCLLVGPDKLITPELIERNIGISKDFNNFELKDALSTRNAVKAYSIIDYFEKNPKNNPTVLTGAILFANFRDLLLARTCQDRTERGVMERLGLSNPYSAKRVIENTRYYSTAACVNIITYIREFDAKSKGVGSRQNEYELLRELVYKILHS